MKPATLSGISRYFEAEYKGDWPTIAGHLMGLIIVIEIFGVEKTLSLYVGKSIELDQEEPTE